MATWKLKLTATIEDEIEVEAETEEEAINNALRDWSFVEASDWETEVIDGPEGWDE